MAHTHKCIDCTPTLTPGMTEVEYSQQFHHPAKCPDGQTCEIRLNGMDVGNSQYGAMTGDEGWIITYYGYGREGVHFCSCGSNKACSALMTGEVTSTHVIEDVEDAQTPVP